MLTICFVLPIALISSNVRAQPGPDERVIRQLRASSNAAIARHDTAGVGAILATDLVVVTSNSVHVQGRAAHLMQFADQFRARPDVVYLRTPDEVRVFTPWGMASERGRWTGSWTDSSGKIRIGGSYFAKWRRVHDRWLVESETYVPETCSGGAYCLRTP